MEFPSIGNNCSFQGCGQLGKSIPPNYYCHFYHGSMRDYKIKLFSWFSDKETSYPFCVAAVERDIGNE